MVELLLSIGAVLHHFLAVVFEWFAVIKELISEIFDEVSFSEPKFFFNSFVRVVKFEGSESSVDSFFQGLSTVEKFTSFVSKGSAQLLNTVKVVHSALDILISFDFTFQFGLELSDFSLLFILCSLASPSTEQVLPEIAVSNGIIFFLFSFNVDTQFCNLLPKLSFDTKDDVIEIISSSDTVLLELGDFCDDWCKMITWVLKISNECSNFVLPDFHVLNSSKSRLVFLSQEKLSLDSIEVVMGTLGVDVHILDKVSKVEVVEC